MGNVLVVVPPFLRVLWTKNSTCYDREEGLGGKTKIPITSGSFALLPRGGNSAAPLVNFQKHSLKQNKDAPFNHQGSDGAIATISEGSCLPQKWSAPLVCLCVWREGASKRWHVGKSVCRYEGVVGCLHVSAGRT